MEETTQAQTAPIVAPASNAKKKNQIIYIIACLVFGGWLAYDGYITQFEGMPHHKFYIEHVVENDGKPDATMQFNRYGSIVLGVGLVFFAFRYFQISKQKIVADDQQLTLDAKTIPYDSIQAINKTHFESKGFFLVTYKQDGGQEQTVKISDRDYDNVGSILDLLIAKIS